MNKKIIGTLLGTALMALPCSAKPDIFNHLSVGVGVGTPGISVELGTPISQWVQMRAGISIMPGIKFHADADYTYNGGYDYGDSETGTVNLKGDLGRVQGQVIFNVYPIPRRALYVAVGAYFGGNKLLKISGYEPNLADPDAKAVIGDYEIPANEEGYISGGLKVKGFRPYLGLGWGRAVPSRRVNFGIELGVQFEGKPKLYTDYGEISNSLEEDDNTFNKVRDALKVYPTLTFRLNFRAF